MSARVTEADPSAAVCAQCGAVVPAARWLGVDLGQAALPEAARCPECAADWRLDGRFALLATVGRGAVGLTWRARTLAPIALHPGLAHPPAEAVGGTLPIGTIVAIKEMPFRVTDAEAVRKLIAREARVLRELDHPAVPTWYADFIAGQGRNRAFYLVQAFVEGHDLEAEAARKRFRVDEVLAVIDEVAGILEYLHDLSPPVVHRDLKPKNIRRRLRDNRLILLDFGAVKDVIDDPGTGGSTVAGTFGYMAPEQFAGDACPASDVYALGVVTAVLLARKTPEQMLSGHALRWQPHVAVAEPVQRLLTAMLEVDPRRRIADGRALRARIAQTRAELAAPEGRPPPSPASEPAAARGTPGRTLVTRAGARPEVGPAQPLPGPGHFVDFTGQVHRLPETPPALLSNQRGRRKGVVLLLGVLLGNIGGPWWYLGHPVMGVLSVMFSWTFVPWVISIIKAARVYSMSDADFDARYNLSLLAQIQQLRQVEALARLHNAALLDRLAAADRARPAPPDPPDPRGS